jgi:hypothetical protein
MPDPDADFLPSRIQGSKRHPIPDPDPQHWEEQAKQKRELAKMLQEQKEFFNERKEIEHSR